MKRWIGICLVALLPVVCAARGYEGDTLGDKLKRIFGGPSATPTPAKKKHKRSTTKRSPTPTATPSPTAVAAEQTPSATPIPTATVSPSESPNETPPPRMHSQPHMALSEPVRAMTPRPGSRHPHVQTPPPGVTISTPPPAEARPTPMNIAPAPSASVAPLPRSTSSIAQETPPAAAPAPSVAPKPAATPLVRRKPTEPATIAPMDVIDYEKYPANVRAVVDLALRLTTQNLGYKYGAADPAKGGMDASGFVQYALTQGGVRGAPRDARDQYIWVRKAGAFQAVLARSDDSFELDVLKPGDLLFWASGYNVGRDPAITDVAIYLGRERGTNGRLMIGASDGRTYKGQAKFGVSVLDFKVAPAKTKSAEETAMSIFVGYARVPE